MLVLDVGQMSNLPIHSGMLVSIYGKELIHLLFFFISLISSGHLCSFPDLHLPQSKV